MSNQTKQWWEDGYDGYERLAARPKPTFVDKPAEGSTHNPGAKFGLWKPEVFWLAVAADGQRLNQKAVIFVDDSPRVFRQHAGKVPNKFLPSGFSWEKFTCGAESVYPAQHYEELKGFKGVDEIPGNFPRCCGEFFIGSSKKGNPMPGYCPEIPYYTVVDTSSYQDKKGITHQFVLKMFAAVGNTIDKLLRQRELNGPLESCVYQCVRYKDKTSPNVGEDFQFEERGDLDQLFPVVMYSGRLLSDWFDQARDNPELMEVLGKIFKLPFDENGKLLNKIPSFNFPEIWKPRPVEELEKLFGKRQPNASPATGSPAASKAVSSKPGVIPGFGKIPGFSGASKQPAGAPKMPQQAPVSTGSQGSSSIPVSKDDDIPF